MQDLARKLENITFEGHSFDCLPIEGEKQVLQVLVSGLDELPIFLTFTPNQIICLSYLFRTDEVNDTKTHEMNRAMLELNPIVPLSSFGLVEGYYVLFGALAVTSETDDICKELVTLASNACDVLQVLEEYLI